MQKHPSIGTLVRISEDALETNCGDTNRRLITEGGWLWVRIHKSEVNERNNVYGVTATHWATRAAAYKSLTSGGCAPWFPEELETHDAEDDDRN